MVNSGQPCNRTPPIRYLRLGWCNGNHDRPSGNKRSVGYPKGGLAPPGDFAGQYESQAVSGSLRPRRGAGVGGIEVESVFLLKGFHVTAEQLRHAEKFVSGEVCRNASSDLLRVVGGNCCGYKQPTGLKVLIGEHHRSSLHEFSVQVRNGMCASHCIYAMTQIHYERKELDCSTEPHP